MHETEIKNKHHDNNTEIARIHATLEVHQAVNCELSMQLQKKMQFQHSNQCDK